MVHPVIKIYKIKVFDFMMSDCLNSFRSLHQKNHTSNLFKLFSFLEVCNHCVAKE
jgi:hypothetical protein